MKSHFPVVNVLGVSFINTTNDKFIHQLTQDIDERKNTFVVTANPEIVMYADGHPDYAATIKDADYVTPDGIGIIKGAQMLNQPLQERITGYDTFLSLLKWGNDQHKSAYFLGAKPEVILDLKKVLTKTYPNLVIAGIHDGYFDNEAPIINDIKESQPDLVFVALGFPKQENLIAKYRHVNNGLWIGIGGSFDVLSGHVIRAPKFWQDHHLEWLYRGLTDPKRAKRLLSLPKYLLKVKKSK
ncbi:WecB/TagA/CpsF family glycosyltransferase [Secundilactobacillus malefermentans]|uniref:WecB/TagA/CpsF family glycosyltransferase n=1 Tax=Secundilactobacillus malefermentans TaxID=176292 RepID=UPI0011C8DB90|nr:WecB/TagA/CpsF family glycosyltransferase [Secundilactobacillus malefermentans]QEA31971.1 WecB/TagA/CpsF family glycosyltransferase [Secundilactobacillus malefermentans]